MLADYLAVFGLSWGLDQKRNGTEPTLTSQTDRGTKLQRTWCRMSQDPVIQYFVLPVPFERGNFRSKWGGKKSKHFNCSDEHIELLLRTVISSNQLSVYEAIADLCNELPEDLRAPEKPAAPDHVEKMEIPTDLPAEENSDQCTATEKPCARIRAKIRTIVRRPEIVPNYALMWVWSMSKKDNTSTPLMKDKKDATFVPRIHDASKREEDSCERMDSQEHEDPSSLGHTSFVTTKTDTVLKFWSNLCFKTEPLSSVRIVGGIDKCVTVSMLTKEEEDIASGKTIAKARPRQKPTVTLTSISILVRERKWIDIETQRSNDQTCLTWQKPLPEELTEQSSTMTSSNSAGRRR